MIVALLVVAVFLLALSFGSEKKAWKLCLQKGTGWMILCGVANGAVNLFVMILSASMPASVMFPLISAGGILATALVAKLLFREKLTVKQYAGMLLGIGAVIFLNL